MNASPSRRGFIGAAAAIGLSGPAFLATARGADTKAQKPRLRKAVKFDMIRVDGSVEKKFELIKSLGFEGVEINSPGGVNRDEALAAKKKTGVEIHGTIDSVHWEQRLSDPDPAVRAKGLAALKTAIDDCAFYGGTTVLLVPGRVSNPQTENFQQCWERSQAEVKKVLPQAEKAGVKIAIETVWNDFITKPDQLVKYVDELNSPAAAAYFDISNMIKYGVAPADWVRALGKRLAKFDFKGYSHKNQWVDIGEGDENWPEVLKALGEIGYNGWATSEVRGGGPAELKEISRRMDKVLGLA